MSGNINLMFLSSESGAQLYIAGSKVQLAYLVKRAWLVWLINDGYARWQS
jgi:hypothetical protein